jgi:hypothetical protein
VNLLAPYAAHHAAKQAHNRAGQAHQQTGDKGESPNPHRHPVGRIPVLLLGRPMVRITARGRPARCWHGDGDTTRRRLLSRGDADSGKVFFSKPQIALGLLNGLLAVYVVVCWPLSITGKASRSAATGVLAFEGHTYGLRNLAAAPADAGHGDVQAVIAMFSGASAVS